MTFTFGSLFAGIGGFDLGLERAGMVCKWQVEIDPFCQKVLAKHWPDVARYSDVRECGKHNLEAVDLIAGGFPCQPFSEAGEQRGEQDDRNLWPEMRRVIAELRPRWIVAENVPGIRNLYLDTVLSDLESLGYTAGTVDLPAVAFGAPHIRHRLFVIAYANRSDQGRGQQQEREAHQRDTQPSRNGTKGRAGPMADAEGKGRWQQSRGTHGEIGAVRCKVNDRWSTSQANQLVGSCQTMADAQKQPIGAGLCQDEQARKWGRRLGSGGRQDRGQWTVEPNVGRVVDGISSELDKHRIAALGNAVVPQVAEWLGRRIMEVERTMQEARP